MESAPPPSSAYDPTIDCSDSLLTERVRNHSEPVIRHRSTTTTTPLLSKIIPNQILPSSMCCREASIIDSDAMEDEMWNSEIDSITNAEGGDATFSPQSNTAPPMKSTLTIETSENKIEVQETTSKAYHESIAKSSTLKDRLLHRIAMRRKKDIPTRRNNKIDPQMIVEEIIMDYKVIPEENIKSSVAVPLLLSRQRSIFGGRRNINPVDNLNNDCKESQNTIIETSNNGESENVLCCTSTNQNDITVNENSNELVFSSIQVLQKLVEDDPIAQSSMPNYEPTIDDSMKRGISGVVTLSYAQAADFQLSQQPSTCNSTGTLSFWSSDTYTSSNDLNFIWIPIITVRVPFDNDMYIEYSIESANAFSLSASRSLPSTAHSHFHFGERKVESNDKSIAGNEI